MFTFIQTCSSGNDQVHKRKGKHTSHVVAETTK